MNPDLWLAFENEQAMRERTSQAFQTVQLKVVDHIIVSIADILNFRKTDLL